MNIYYDAALQSNIRNVIAFMEANKDAPGYKRARASMTEVAQAIEAIKKAIR